MGYKMFGICIPRRDLNTFILCLSDASWTPFASGHFESARPCPAACEGLAALVIHAACGFCISLLPHTCEHVFPPLPLPTRLHWVPQKLNSANISFMSTTTFMIWALFGGGSLPPVPTYPTVSTVSWTLHSPDSYHSQKLDDLPPLSSDSLS